MRNQNKVASQIFGTGEKQNIEMVLYYILYNIHNFSNQWSNSFISRCTHYLDTKDLCRAQTAPHHGYVNCNREILHSTLFPPISNSVHSLKNLLPPSLLAVGGSGNMSTKGFLALLCFATFQKDPKTASESIASAVSRDLLVSFPLDMPISESANWRRIFFLHIKL